MYNPQLETFLCVAEYGSFNKAAEKLYISPPAVIKQINLLEESLDLQLFVRTHRGFQLTESGNTPPAKGQGCAKRSTTPELAAHIIK